MNIRSMRSILFLSSFLLLSGCDWPLQTMASNEYAVIFRRLPTFLGGGVVSQVAPPGQVVVVWPWDTLYTYISSVREVAWGPGRMFPEHISTRCLDGNEVSLAVTVRYQIDTDPAKLVELAQRVATDDKKVQDIVTSIARADIRHYMNELKTSEFIDPKAWTKAVARVADNMQGRLGYYGIKVLSVNLDDFRFERTLPDGTKDSSYQEKLNETQRWVQDTQRELERIDTEVAKKQKLYNEAQAEVNRMIEEAKGVKAQADVRGQNYLKAKNNEAQSVLARGKAEVEGLVAQINALAGPGGKAILKLEVANQLAEGRQRFIVVEGGQKHDSVNVNKTDTNELIRQFDLAKGIGVIEALKTNPPQLTGSQVKNGEVKSKD